MHMPGGIKILLFLTIPAFICVFASAAVAQDDYTPVYHPELSISKTTGPINIDGHLNDPGWNGAALATNFAEHNPGDQTKPDVKTEVKITYDDNHLYVAWICYDDPAEVRASFCERDQIFSDDYVILLIDTYGEATLAYEIAANPYGIPGDLLFSSAYGEDISYNVIFESSGRITEFGWVVEMAIPFTSLRFPDRDEQTWRVDFWRNRPRGSRFQYSWAAYDRDENCWPCKWGTVTGINDVESGSGFELLPAVVSYQSGSMTDDVRFANEDIDGEFGLGISYDISSELTAEATINPDFSQVESDVAQIDVNTTFALSYPERRPFFQEGSDLFRTYFNAVYTRSINDPLLAGKITWRNGSNSVAVLSARDERSAVIMPFEESSKGVGVGKSYSNIVRARHDLGEQSHVGLIGTDRRFDTGGSGSLFGIDSQIRLSQSNTLKAQVLATHTEEIDDLALTDSSFNVTTFDGGKYTAGLDGEKFWGHAWFLEASRNTGNYWGNANYMEYSPTFRADNGMIASNNTRVGNVSVGGTLRFENSKILETISPNANVGRKWNFDGTKKDEWFNANLSLNFRAAQTQMHARFMASNELFGGVQFDNIWLAHNCVHVQPFDALRFGGHLDYGHRIARMFLVMSTEINTGIWADIKLSDRFLIASFLNYSNGDDVDTEAWLFSQTIFRSRFSLQVTRELSARIVVQYHDRRDAWDANTLQDAWAFDPLITYQINPLTVFYIGSTCDFQLLNQTDHNREGWTLMDRQYFVKLQYLFQS